MKLAIHHRPGSFSDRWILFCNERKIDYKIVNCFDNDFIQQIKDCNALLWHHHHENFKDVIIAKKILFAIQHVGLKVFPNFNSSWHFDDKVAQKYLLELIDVPTVPSYVFYDKFQALNWAKEQNYPIVFKLKGGAGAENVILVKSFSDCKNLINTAFKKGFKQFDGKRYFLDTIIKYQTGNKTFKQILYSFGRMLISTEYSRNAGRERGYVYFQEFIPNNKYDIRIIVIGSRAFGLKRMVRKGDFRASGSGSIIYSIDDIDVRCVEIAFKANKKIQSQSLAFDFVFDKNSGPLIVEISYAFSVNAYDACEGFWTEDLQFHKEPITPQIWMIEELIKSI